VCARCCCLLFVSLLCVSLAVLGIRSRIAPRRFVKDACANERHPGARVLDGFPFICGWQQLRPAGFGGSTFVPHAFIQPNGSWCWSNAGFLSSGLLVDTLTDPVLTAEMLSGLKDEVKALLFTHPDVDHISGNQAVPAGVPRLGTRAAQQEVTAQQQSGMIGNLVLAMSLGHFIWETAQLVGLAELFNLVPTALQGLTVKVLGWARSQMFMAHFNFEAVEVDRLPIFSEFLESGSSIIVAGEALAARFRHFGPVHSKSDSVLILPDAKVVYTGDLLFIGIAPVMWSGPAKAWLAALDGLLEETGPDWLFVPGHGPVTDVEGLRGVRRYFEYLDEAVTETCADLAVEDAALDEVCAERVLEAMPALLLELFQEPQRIMICAAIERMARRAGGPAKVELKHKIKYLTKMGEYEVRQALQKGAASTGGRQRGGGGGEL